MDVKIYKTLTETTNGRRQNPDSPTGWSRRSDDSSRTWIECDPPRTVVYGSEEHVESGIRGGTLNTHVEGVEDGIYNLPARDVELLIRHYLKVYEDGAFLADGGTMIGVGTSLTARDGVELMVEGIRNLARFGVDATTLELGRGRV